MHIDPIVRERFGLIDDQNDGQEITIFQCVGCLQNLRRRRRIERAHEVADRQGREKLTSLIDMLISLSIARHERRDGRTVMFDACDATVLHHRAPLLRHAVTRHLPHLSWAEPRILERINECFDDFAFLAALCRQIKQPKQTAHEAESLDALGGPIGGDLVVGMPQTFSVYVLKKIWNSVRPNRFTTQSSKLRSGEMGNVRALA